MNVTLTLCSETGEWSAAPCPADCPGEEHETCTIPDPGATVARLLNVIRSAFDDILDGDECMTELSEAYESVTGMDIGY